VVTSWDPRGRFGRVDVASGKLLDEHVVSGRWA
jgi:hypothetical protein